MIAVASSSSDRALETVKLVLLLEVKKQDYPSTLKNYFRDVIKQTVELLEKPSDSAYEVMPEAVSLAVRLSSNDELRAVIKEILKNDITSKRAEKALNNLEVNFDPNSESAHFSKEIYASI